MSVLNRIRPSMKRLWRARFSSSAISFVLAAGLVASWPGMGISAAGEAPGCLVVQHFYFVKEGKEAEALATRIKGNEVRAALGLSVSRLLEVQSSASGHPSAGGMKPGNASYLMSETVFKDQAEADKANEILAGSEDYIAVRAHMGSLLDHFEVAVRKLVGGGC